jgi:hypothetical protein
MERIFFRLVELVFTAYAVPALLVPVVWLVRRLGRSWFPRRASTSRDLSRVGIVYGALALAWVIVWGAVLLGVPIERGGPVAAAACWTGYAIANFTLAWLLVVFTADYGSLPDGREKDRLFLRLVGAVAAQPVLTAVAFAVLYRVMGVAYQLWIPGLAAVQEGI